jgi:hypothetical protein
MKQLTRDFARAQGKRLQASPMMAPQSKEGVREIVDCLMRHCQSEEHAERTITAFLDGATEPKNLTAELAAIARRSQIPDQLPAGCPRCFLGPDVDSGEVRWAAHVPGVRGGYSVALRCECERGEWLAAKDQERKAANPPAERAAPIGREDWMKKAAGDLE